ncbi:MAG: DUF1800 family protein [Akkermansiaceae bacterium]
MIIFKFENCAFRRVIDFWKVLTLSIGLFIVQDAYGVDDDEDGLSDVWQHYFNTGALTREQDSDGDGYSNLKESIAGTNPRDAGDKPILLYCFEHDGASVCEFSFKTIFGKFYQIEGTDDLSGFTAIDAGWVGDGQTRTLALSDDDTLVTTSPIKAEFWSDISTDVISDLNTQTGFPLSPDGLIYIAEPEAPKFLAVGYGGKLSTQITPPSTGAYKFYLSSGVPAQLYVSDSTEASGAELIAEVLPTQAGMSEEEWNTYESQSSDFQELVEGQSYYLELRYVGGLSLLHSQVAWSGVGLSGIQKIEKDALASVDVPLLADADNVLYNADLTNLGSINFFQLAITDQDQDGDGLSDMEELSMAEFRNVLFFDEETTTGVPDDSVVTTGLLLSAAEGKAEVSLYATDAAAFESNYPSTIVDEAEITLTRTGELQPLAVKICVEPLESTGSTATVCDGSCCTLIGSAGDEIAEVEDYIIKDEDGVIINDTVHFAFGETLKVLTITAVDDDINEYPETLNIAIDTTANDDYDVSPTQNGASIQLFDLPESDDNITLFTGTFSRDGNADSTKITEASGFVTATINGPRTEIRMWNEFSNLSSDQQDSHVHKSGTGNSPGSIIFEIVETVTDTGGNPIDIPLNGALSNHLWDLSDSSGAVSTSGGAASKQVIIDSLFGQNDETPLYLNIHSIDHPNGEIWAFFGLSEGSVIDPGDAPADDVLPQLSGDELESEVRRFLNQATFGATEENVAALLSKIETERLTDTEYHRLEAFSDWIDDQINPEVVKQTYLLDLTLASHFQHFEASQYFDESASDVPVAYPDVWPTVNRSDERPEYWYLNDEYPISTNDYNQAKSNGFTTFNVFGREDALAADWQMKLNGRDQLRHKMGFALQQIVVASDADRDIYLRAYASVNYRDMLNEYAFEYYRDVLGFVNWSPVMGQWLSSTKNEKATDFDGDGIYDSYPDENLARENMQLFSIGLFDIWTDGTLKLSNEGLPRQSYTNDDIKEFAKIITGQSFSLLDGDNNHKWGGMPFSEETQNDSFYGSAGARGPHNKTYTYPMKMFGEYHSLGTKTFAGTTIDNTSITDPDELGVADIESAMDWLAGKPGDGLPDFDMVSSHVSTPAFISKLLIQRFTTSNPSKEYLHRVATVFKNSEGHLGETVKAILLDSEAREYDLNNQLFGMKKSPLEAFIQFLRAMEAHTHLPLDTIDLNDADDVARYDTGQHTYPNPAVYLSYFSYPESQINGQERNVRFRKQNTTSTEDSGLQMDLFKSASVFNYYLPDYTKGGSISEAGLVAPEMQIATEPDVVRNINFFEGLIYESGSRNYSSSGALIARYNGQVLNFLGSSNAYLSIVSGSLRLPLNELADKMYPSGVITATATRTSESLADQMLVDAIDDRLTSGLFRKKYSYDSTDDDDPNIAGVDDSLKNPYEIIIDAITAAHGDNDHVDKLQDALYLVIMSPEFQIRK